MEGKIQREIVRYLNDFDFIKAINFHGNQFTETGTPDISACVDGQMVRIEVKNPESSHGLTRIQAYRMKEWEDVGADCIVAQSVDDVKEYLKKEGYEL